MSKLKNVFFALALLIGAALASNAQVFYTLKVCADAAFTQCHTVPVVASDTFSLLAAAQTFTTKTISLASNTLTGTTAQFNTALSDNDFATLAGSETLTNKTLTTVLGLITLQGTTSSFPAFKRSTTEIQVRLADDSAYAPIDTASYRVAGGPKLFVNTAPTISAGGCTAPAVTWHNGTAAFKITIGTTCTGVSTVTVALAAVTNQYVCRAEDQTNQALYTIAANGTSTTAVVFSNYSRTTGLISDFADSQVFVASCTGA